MPKYYKKKNVFFLYFCCGCGWGWGCRCCCNVWCYSLNMNYWYQWRDIKTWNKSKMFMDFWFQCKKSHCNKQLNSNDRSMKFVLFTRSNEIFFSFSIGNHRLSKVKQNWAFHNKNENKIPDNYCYLLNFSILLRLGAEHNTKFHAGFQILISNRIANIATFLHVHTNTHTWNP